MGCCCGRFRIRGPAELVVLSEKTANFESSSISYPNFLDWQRSNSSFVSIAAYRGDDFSITGSGEAERVRVGMVSAGFFETLGVNPTRGRLFTADEDRLGTEPVALITAGLWQTQIRFRAGHRGEKNHDERQRLHGYWHGTREFSTGIHEL